MKFYIAGRFARQHEFRKYRTELIALGHSVTSRWLDEVTPANPGDEFKTETAYIDLADIYDADVMLFFAEEAYNQPPRGGRHVEFGYALALRKPIYVVGEKENVFHYCYIVNHFATVEDFLGEVGPHVYEKREAPCGQATE